MAGVAVVAQGRRSGELFAGDTLPASTDILFVSHFLRPSQAKDGTDLYFGDAPAALAGHGISSVTALINHSRHDWRQLRPDWQQGRIVRVLLSRRLGMAAEASLNGQLRRGGKRLQFGAEPGETPFARRVREMAAARATASGASTALRIGLQIEDLVSRLRPKVLVTTYEGHSWERLAFRSARNANPGIACIGYHHALLFPDTTAMVNLLGHDYDPDMILTAGNNSRAWFSAQASLAGLPVQTLGSVRLLKIAGTLEQRSASRTCLIIPEGTPSESIKLISLAAEAARRAPHIHFRIRLHPVLRATDLQREKWLASLPSNMSWSDSSFDDDLGQSRFVLYRGSTAVISATLAGIRPIYFDDGGVMIDPLRALDRWRASVADAPALVGVIEHDLVTDSATRQGGFESAAAYCRECYTSFDLSVLQSLVSPVPKS